MDREKMDLFRKDGSYAGDHLRGNPVPKGYYVHTVAVYTMNSKRELLLTRRSPKKSYGGKWENTTGAVRAGESSIQAALRELQEETGILAREEDLVYLGKIESTREDSIMFSYFLQRDLPIEEIKLQPGETDAARWAVLEWKLAFDPALARPARIRLLYFWQELSSFLDPESREDVASKELDRYQPWLSWAKSLQFWAQQGIAYTKDPFDLERFSGISKIASQMLAHKSGISPQKVLGLFAGPPNLYRTPNVEVRAAVFRGESILLVKEKKPQKWSMPGGWCDAGLTISENAVKEVWEESGLRVKAKKIIAIEDRSRHDYKFVIPYDVYKIYVLCEEVGPEEDFVENIETSERAFFPLDQLPELSQARISERMVKNAFLARGDDWQVLFD